MYNVLRLVKNTNTHVLPCKAVSAHFTSKQIPFFGLEEQYESTSVFLKTRGLWLAGQREWK